MSTPFCFPFRGQEINFFKQELSTIVCCRFWDIFSTLLISIKESLHLFFLKNFKNQFPNKLSYYFIMEKNLLIMKQSIL